MSELGSKLRQRRLELGLSGAELARRTGFSTSFISQVERSLANPSVAALKRMADALDTTVSSFFEPAVPPRPGNHQVVVRRNERKKLIYPGTNIQNELLTPDLRGNIELLWVDAPSGTHSGAQWLQHAGEDAGVVLQGVLELTVDEQQFVLEPGDSFHFSSSAPHRWRNAGSERLVLVWVTAPPAF